MKTTFEIHYKGNVAAIRRDLSTGQNFSDFSFGSGTIRFIGTDDQLDDYVEELQRVSPGIKIVGITDTRLTLARIEVFKEQPVEPSIFKIEDTETDEISKFGSATIAQIVNLIEDAGHFPEIMRFLKSEDRSFLTWIDRMKLKKYIESNPLKIEIK